MKDPRVDVECPIKCGQCCDLWAEAGVVPCSIQADLMILMGCDCPNLGPQGCKLEREKRVDDCVGYLCPPVVGLMAGALTLRQAKRIVRRGEPWMYDHKDYLKWIDKLGGILRIMRLRELHPGRSADEDHGCRD